MLIRQLLMERYAPLYQLSDRTKVLYGHTLDRFDEFLGRPGTLDDLDDVVVSQFLAHRLTDPKRPVRRTTVLKDRVQLLAIANYAAKKRLIPEFLTLKPMRAAGRLPQAYMPDDVHRLLDVCRQLPGLEAGLPRAWWWSTHLGVFVETAGRIGEIKVLCWRHVDRDRQVVLYEAESRKGKTRDIERGISSGLAELLEQHRGAPEAPVWPWVLGNEMRYHRLRQLCKKAGVTYRGFHAFRKTAASVVAAQGGSAQQLLDHDRASTSERHYLDNRIVGRRVSAAEALGLRFALPGTAQEQSPHTR
jgi:integrase